MFEDYYGLREKPFKKTPDPRYLFLNQAYEEALEQLLYAVEERELALLSGEVGSGKTLLTRALLDRLPPLYQVAMVLNPRLSPSQFLWTVASELDIPEPASRVGELLEQIHGRLLDLDAEGKAALLIVDEAHLIPGKATFEEIRLLTNFQLDDRNLIAVVLSGQPELRERLLKRRAYRALTQRIGAHFHLLPLTVEDTGAYLDHRLSIAGAERRLFTEAAVRLLHAASGGVPRVINHLATQALIEGMARGSRLVDEVEMAAACEDQPFVMHMGRGPLRPVRGPLAQGKPLVMAKTRSR
ncbi:MAG TPA: AAA family ATPase [Vicinamibacteria bacterium]|nr:AAA family ATPase [Vicinamibacteria bacterium]